MTLNNMKVNKNTPVSLVRIAKLKQNGVSLYGV